MKSSSYLSAPQFTVYRANGVVIAEARHRPMVALEHFTDPRLAAKEHGRERESMAERTEDTFWGAGACS